MQAIADETRRRAALLELLDELRARLGNAASDSNANLRGVYASALFEADGLGLLPVDDAAALGAWTAPVREHGPAASAAAIAYLAAYHAALLDPPLALAWLEDCERRFPNESFAAPQRFDLRANLEHRRGRQGEALRLADAAIAAASRSAVPPHEELAQYHGSRAEFRFDLGLFDVADADLDAAERHARAAGTPDARFDVLTIRLNQYLGLGRFDRVVELTAERAEFGAERAHELAVYRATALRFLRRERPDAHAEARELLDAAIGSGTLEPGLRATARHKRLALALDEGDLESAEADRIQLEAERPLSAAGFASASHDLVDYDLVDYDLVDYDTVALGTRTLLARGRTEELAARRPLHAAAFAALLARWDAAERREAGLGRLHLDRWNRLVGEYLRLVLACEPGEAGARAALDALLEVQARASLARVLGAAPVDAAELRAALGEGAGVLIFQALDHASLIVAVDRDGIACVETVGSSMLSLAAKELLRLLDAGHDVDERFESERTRVGAMVLPPAIAERVRGWRELSVVGDELLQGLPIEVLELPRAEGDARPATLGERLAIDHVSSLGAWLSLAKRAIPRGGGAFWATLEPAAGLVVDGARRVPQRLLEALPPSTGELANSIVLDRSAGVAALLAADLRSRAWLHLVAHGAWVDDREIAAVLALHPDETHRDGLFGAEHVAALRHVPPLVFLSACGAGSSHPRRGDGWDATLAGAFLRRGARAVVLRGGDLEFEPQVALIGAFHRAFAAGASPAEAMRRARAELGAGTRSPRRLRELALQVVGNGQGR